MLCCEISIFDVIFWEGLDRGWNFLTNCKLFTFFHRLDSFPSRPPYFIQVFLQINLHLFRAGISLPFGISTLHFKRTRSAILLIFFFILEKSFESLANLFNFKPLLNFFILKLNKSIFVKPLQYFLIFLLLRYVEEMFIKGIEKFKDSPSAMVSSSILSNLHSCIDNFHDKLCVIPIFTQIGMLKLHAFPIFLPLHCHVITDSDSTCMNEIIVVVITSVH